MKKTVIIELEAENDFESIIYNNIGDLAAELEDHYLFDLKSIKVADFVEPKTEGLGHIGRSYNAGS